MDWLIFALLAPVFWAFTVIFDKFLITKVFSKTYFFPIWIAILGIPLCIFIFIFFNPQFIFPYSVIAILEGGLWALYYYILAKTLSSEEVSRAMALMFTYPIFVTILAGIFLNEFFSILKYIGIVLLVVGGVLLSYKKEGKRIGVTGSLKFILILILLLSCIEVTDKFVVGKIGYWSLYFWVTFGLFPATFPFLFMKEVRTTFVKSLKKISKRDFLVLIITELFAIYGSVSYYIAVFLGSVSIISAIGALQPFFVLIYMLFLSIFIPRFLKEELSKHNILVKFISVLFVLVGTCLLI